MHAVTAWALLFRFCLRYTFTPATLLGDFDIGAGQNILFEVPIPVLAGMVSIIINLIIICNKITN
jgi:hypothetical protein